MFYLHISDRHLVMCALEMLELDSKDFHFMVIFWVVISAYLAKYSLCDRRQELLIEDPNRACQTQVHSVIMDRP